MRCFITNVCSCRMSTQRNILCLMALVLSGAMEFANACTSAIISGKVTPDGRPIMWKNRDAENLKNCVRSHLSRSFHNPLMGIDLKDGKHNKPETSGWFAEQDFIARRSTSCAVAIQGVRPDEDASFTTMWTVIGYPANTQRTGATTSILPARRIRLSGVRGCSGSTAAHRVPKTASTRKSSARNTSTARPG